MNSQSVRLNEMNYKQFVKYMNARTISKVFSKKNQKRFYLEKC